MKPHTTGHRRDTLWIAALVHRVSGVALACFLPLHFLVLGLALEGEARLEGFLRWTDQPLVKLAEGGLVFLLAVHVLGGLRLLAMEMGPWREGQSRRAIGIFAVAAVLGGLFLINMF